MHKYLKDIDEKISCFFLVLLVGITVIGVFARYALNNPIGWTEEVSLALFIWLTMMGSASAMRKKQHISIDFLVELLPQGMRKKLEVLVTLINISVLSTIAYLSYQLSVQSVNRLTSVLKLPYSYINMSITVGCFFTIIVELNKLLISFKEAKYNLEVKKGEV